MAGRKVKDDVESLSLITTYMENNEHYKGISQVSKTQKKDKLDAHKDDSFDTWKKELKIHGKMGKAKNGVAYATIGPSNCRCECRNFKKGQKPGKNSWKSFKGICNCSREQGHRVVYCPNKARAGPGTDM